MTYTPEEHRDAAEAIKTLVRKHAPPPRRPAGWGEIGVYGAPNEFDLAKAVLDAVLPGYTQRVQAEALTKAADGIVPGEHSCFKPYCALRAVRADRQRQKDSLKRRAAALAAPVEPTLHNVDPDGDWNSPEDSAFLPQRTSGAATNTGEAMSGLAQSYTPCACTDPLYARLPCGCLRCSTCSGYKEWAHNDSL